MHKEYDTPGISAVFINLEKGEKLFNNIKKQLIYYNANIEDIIKYNPCFCNSASYNDKRENFFEDLDKCDFYNLLEKYLK